MKTNPFVAISAFLGLYLLSTGASFAVFTYVMPASVLNMVSPAPDTTTTTEPEQKESKFKALLDISGPKTEACPLNGMLFTKAEKDAWEKRRPLMVMIENHEESRPQSGLSSADIVYETVAEGGITRFMGVFYCDAQSHEIITGPVRSARTYFMNWASEYSANPLYTHVGGANCNHGCPGGTSKADALGQIEAWDWGGATGNDLSQFSIGYPTFWRDYERLGRTVATEHTMYSTTERLWAVAKKRGWNYEDAEGNKWDEDFEPWKVMKAESGPAGKTTQIDYDFWSSSPAGDYSVAWKYDPAKKVYLRSNAGQPHKDLNTEEQIGVKNVIVMYSEESTARDGYPGDIHLVYENIGTGDAVLFQEGNAEEITWSKKSRIARTKFLDANNKEIELVPGHVWISNVPVGNKTMKY